MAHGVDDEMRFRIPIPPQGTLFVLIIISVLYYIKVYKIEPNSLWKLSLIPYEIKYGKLWTLFTAPLFHTTFQHFILNVIFIWQRFSHIEKRAGSAFLYFHIVMFSVETGVMYSLIVILFSYTGSYKYFYKPLLGLSSVIISLNVIETKLSTNKFSSLLGLIKLPTKLMPIALSITFSLALKNASIIAYVCAIVCGELHWLIFQKFLLRLWHSPTLPKVIQNNDETQNNIEIGKIKIIAIPRQEKKNFLSDDEV